MNQITMFRLMLIISAYDDTIFPILVWLYASALEVEWWCESARKFIVENNIIKKQIVDKLSENR